MLARTKEVAVAAVIVVVLIGILIGCALLVVPSGR